MMLLQMRPLNSFEFDMNVHLFVDVVDDSNYAFDSQCWRTGQADAGIHLQG